MKRIRSKNINTPEHFNEIFSNNFETYNSYANITYYNKILNLQLFSCKSYLDYGCGNGQGLWELREKLEIPLMYGVDISDEVIRKNKQLYRPAIFLTTKEYFDSPITVDVIVSTHTIEHLDDPQEIVFKLLQHTQKLFVIVPHKESWIECPEHIWMFDTYSFSSLKPKIALPGIINEAGNRELIFYWDKLDTSLLNSFKILLIKIKILQKSSMVGVLKYLYRRVKYIIKRPIFS